VKHPLEGSAAKVKRASLHLETLHTEIRGFVKSEPKPYRFVSKVDVETSRYLLRIVIEREPPIEWSLITGDFVQNLRAALDYLVWQLVIANGREPSHRNAFPLFDGRPELGSQEARTWSRMVRGVSTDALDFIEYCQPYRGGDGPGAHLLTALRELSNEDKHRTLLAAYSAIEANPGAMDFEVVGVRDVRSPVEGGKVYAGRPLNNYDLVLESPVVITGPNPEVKLNGELPMDVGFGWKPVPLQGLRQMVQSVAEIVAACRNFV